MERVPPQNIEAEQAVLGAVLIEKEALITAAETLIPEDFYRQAHQRLFRVMLDLAERNEPVDLVTLTAELTDRQLLEDVGGVTYLTDLAGAVPTAANVEHYAHIVEEKAILRRLIQTATHIASTGYTGSEEVTDIIAEAERRILSISDRRTHDAFVPIKDVLLEAFERLEHLHQHQGQISGIPSGYPDLDRMTSGFQKSDLIIVAARPSVGKTAFALNIAQNVAVRSGEPVAIFSLEMSAAQLAQRMLCAESNIDSHKFRTGMMEDEDWEKLTLAIGTLAEAPIYIDDSAGTTMYDIRGKCRRLKVERGVGLVLIDYLQLINSHRGRESRQQEISEISRGLKSLARELDCPVIALSQLSRGVEQRQDKRPMLSDLRESGSIEQDADIVAFLYREDYYDPETDKQNIIEIIIGKQRNGPIGKVELVFLKNYNKFVSLDKSYREEPVTS